MNNHFLLRNYLELWKDISQSRRYNEWCKENHGYIEEEFKKFLKNKK